MPRRVACRAVEGLLFRVQKPAKDVAEAQAGDGKGEPRGDFTNHGRHRSEDARVARRSGVRSAVRVQRRA